MARETQQGNTKHDDQPTPRPLGDAGRPRRDPGAGSPAAPHVRCETGPLTPSADLLDEIRRMIREEGKQDQRANKEREQKCEN